MIYGMLYTLVYRTKHTLAHLSRDEIPKKKGKQAQQNSDPIACQMFSFVLVDVHIVKLSCIILGHLYHGERQINS